MTLIATLVSLLCTAPLADEARQVEQIESLYQELKATSFSAAPDLEWSERRSTDVLLDVRTPAERSVSIIPGAIPPEALPSVEDLGNRRVVVYCTIGHRSGLETVQLRERGYDAWNLRGGILAYTHAGGELQDDGNATRTVHTWGPSFDLVAEGYEATW